MTKTRIIYQDERQVDCEKEIIVKLNPYDGVKLSPEQVSYYIDDAINYLERNQDENIISTMTGNTLIVITRMEEHYEVIVATPKFTGITKRL